MAKKYDKRFDKNPHIRVSGLCGSGQVGPRDVAFMEGQNYVFVGLRHAGKSYLMFQRIAQLIAQGHKREEILYFNFEDDRIDSLELSDLDLIKTCYEEMYDCRPIFFLDEIQLVDRWEKFARRLADQKYQVYITGSNAKMLSSEIATTLGGRYMIHEVYPYSLTEYLKASGIDVKAKNALYAHGKEIMRLANTYFQHGGLPETVGMKEPRPWMSNLFGKIFFGDLVARYKIRNDYALRVMIRKMAESVKQPLSYSRIASIVSSTGKKLSTDATIDYVGHMTDTWLILPYENLFGKLQDKESRRKYYFTDNGLLHLFLVDANTSLLEPRCHHTSSAIWRWELFLEQQECRGRFRGARRSWRYKYLIRWRTPRPSGGRRTG